MRIIPDPGVIGIQEFLCGPQIRIGSVPYGTDPLLRIQLGCKQSSCVKGTYSRHLVDSKYHALNFSWTMVFRVCLSPPNTTIFMLPLNGYGLDGHANSSQLTPFEGRHQNGLDACWSINAVTPRFVRYIRFI